MIDEYRHENNLNSHFYVIFHYQFSPVIFSQFQITRSLKRLLFHKNKILPIFLIQFFYSECAYYAESLLYYKIHEKPVRTIEQENNRIKRQLT